MFLVCGDALFDMFLEREDGPGAATYSARAGGSPFNVAIGLARLGARSAMLTGLSRDMLGQRLTAVLAAEGVSADYVIPTDRATTISLVGLDADGRAGLPVLRQARTPACGRRTCRRSGRRSPGCTSVPTRLAASPVGDAMAALAQANRDRFISVDPNVRPTVVPDMEVWRGAAGGALPAGRSGQDQRRGPRAALARQAGRRRWPADLIAAGVSLVVVTDGGEAAHGWTAAGLHATAVAAAGQGRRHGGRRRHLPGGAPRPAPARSGRAEGGARGTGREGLASLVDYAARAAAITCSRRGADLPRAAELTD